MLFLGRRHSYFCGCVCTRACMHACSSRVRSGAWHHILYLQLSAWDSWICIVLLKRFLQEALGSLRNKTEAFSMHEQSAGVWGAWVCVVRREGTAPHCRWAEGQDGCWQLNLNHVLATALDKVERLVAPQQATYRTKGHLGGWGCRELRGTSGVGVFQGNPRHLRWYVPGWRTIPLSPSRVILLSRLSSPGLGRADNLFVAECRKLRWHSLNGAM